MPWALTTMDGQAHAGGYPRDAGRGAALDAWAWDWRRAGVIVQVVVTSLVAVRWCTRWTSMACALTTMDGQAHVGGYPRS
jgi:hypothetical protein